MYTLHINFISYSFLPNISLLPLDPGVLCYARRNIKGLKTYSADASTCCGVDYGKSYIDNNGVRRNW